MYRVSQRRKRKEKRFPIQFRAESGNKKLAKRYFFVVSRRLMMKIAHRASQVFTRWYWILSTTFNQRGIRIEKPWTKSSLDCSKKFWSSIDVVVEIDSTFETTNRVWENYFWQKKTFHTWTYQKNISTTRHDDKHRVLREIKKFSMSRHSIFLLATVHGASILLSAGFVCVSAISMDWREFPRKKFEKWETSHIFRQWMWELMLFSAWNFENTQGEILTSQSDFSREIVKNFLSLLCRWNSVINDEADKRDFPF